MQCGKENFYSDAPKRQRPLKKKSETPDRPVVIVIIIIVIVIVIVIIVVVVVVVVVVAAAWPSALSASHLAKTAPPEVELVVEWQREEELVPVPRVQVLLPRP